jgi:hypothetical protein
MPARAGGRFVLLASVCALALSGCGAKATPEATSCDEKCADGVALRSLREVLKFAYNQVIAGKRVGPQDAVAREFRSGTVHVFGNVTSNAAQGLTFVEDLTYEISQCALTHVDNTADQNYDMTFDGVVVQNGTIAVQPTAPTALSMKSEGITMSGTVYDPSQPYDVAGCAVDVTQNGNNVSGKLCGRTAGFDF